MAEQKRILSNRRSIGRRKAWTLRMLLAMVLRVPVMSFVALHWVGISHFATVTELVCLELLGEGQMDVNQTSAAYMKAGTATVL